MAGSSILLSYTEKKEGKGKEFIIRHTENSKVVQSKSFSVGVKRNSEQAYEEAVKVCEQWGKAAGINPNIKSHKELISAFEAKHKSKTSAPSEPKKLTSTSPNPLVEKFGNALAFAALIKHAIRVHGSEKVEEVLSAAQEIVSEAKLTEVEQRRVIDTANRRFADVIFEARNSGVDIEPPNAEVAQYLSILISKKSSPGSRNQPIGLFRLPDGGEEWNGAGHMPPAFTKYLLENKDKEIFDLKVN